MKWFSNCHNLEEVKAMYKKLAKQFHPDLGGDTVAMQEINREFAFASAQAIKGEGNKSEEEVAEEIRLSEEYRKAIAKVIHLDGIVVEVVGYWIWVTGDTYPWRATLKQAGFMFAPKKMAWYFRTADYAVSKGGKKSLDEIREKYGSEKLQEDRAKRKYLN
ncbi:J domain-containing protein [Nubsella zeaxanthinifaciens]|uniref:J domain-containing protein n=1 Tax=Nubsella zeaxanthinifaciens TaxID=392412 RepID=UPI003D0587F5